MIAADPAFGAVCPLLPSNVSGHLGHRRVVRLLVDSEPKDSPRCGRSGRSRGQVQRPNVEI